MDDVRVTCPRSWRRAAGHGQVPLLLAFAVLVTLAVDLGRPVAGLSRLGQAAILELQETP